jgi:D-alanyl-D-alanine carboxypeptidase/D-alanyl-D-alanine-endopeptidase (penicillin-binding protein 4)
VTALRETVTARAFRGGLATLIVFHVLPRAAAADDDPSEAQLRAQLQEILRAPALDDALVGVHVRSLSDGRTIFERNGTKLFNPASNVKLVTTAAALWYLGSSYRFRTIAYRDASLRGGTLSGNLYVKGRGDPMLTSEELFGFVNEIALHGIEKIEGNIVVDDEFFDSVWEGPGWDQERSDKSYAPPVGALSVNFGTFSIRAMPGDRVGAPARVSVWPDVPSIELSSTVVTRGRDTRRQIWVGTTRDDDGKLEVTVRGALPLGDIDGVTVYKRVYNPPLYAGEAIRRMLELRGIPVKGRVVRGTSPGTAIPVATHFSLPLAKVVSILNKHSNNFIAEQILKTLGAEVRGGQGTWEKGCDVVREFLEQAGIPRSSFVFGNGSGLNDINRLTPEQVTRLLDAMYKRFEVQPEFVASLAVAGVSGTINSRFADEPAMARLRAKTGSLQGVSALSGYVVTQDNKLLAFSVMMNDYHGRARSMWSIQDRIGNALAEFKSADVIAQP